MDRLIYTAMSGMSDSMTRQRVIASNMANAQTVGFRAEMIYSTPVTVKQGNALEVRAMSDGEVHGAQMRPGVINQTGQPLDVAMNGEAMLTVQAEDGSEAYTRRGDLSISPTGVLQNGDGRPVLGNGGPITVPPNSTVVITPEGGVMVSNPATPDQPATQLDKLKLASPAGTKIGKGLDGLFRVIGGGVLPDDANASLIPGAVEQSNVNPSEVMVQMVQAQRLYDIRTKMIATAREVDQSGSALMRISAGA
ncbi:MAG: flagellar basal body rod protein FlgF [Sphingomonadales bacterium]|nr:flagellar basal body rod protein FlgF [Sphingomonadales bacterium]